MLPIVIGIGIVSSNIWQKADKISLKFVDGKIDCQEIPNERCFGMNSKNEVAGKGMVSVYPLEPKRFFWTL